MPVLRHVHTYERSKLNKTVYRCTDPGCSHFARRELLIGKYALCGACGMKFVLDEKQLENKVPRCLNCANTKEAHEYREVRSLLGEIIREADIKEALGKEE